MGDFLLCLSIPLCFRARIKLGEPESGSIGLLKIFPWRRVVMAEDGEEAEHLLGMMADGHRKARRGRNLLLATGSAGRVRVWRWDVLARMDTRMGPQKRQGEMAAKVADKVRCTEGRHTGMTAYWTERRAVSVRSYRKLSWMRTTRVGN